MTTTNSAQEGPVQQKVVPGVAVVSIGVLLLTWYAVTRPGLIKPVYLPSPERVIAAAHDIGFPLFRHAGATLLRVVVGFLCGALAGVAFGLWMSSSKYVYSAMVGIIESWRPVPPVALIPFFVIAFGFSNLGKVVLAAIGVFLIVVIDTLESVRRVRPVYLRVGANVGAGKGRLYRSIILPAILPSLIPGCRIGLALSISLVIVGEFMGATWGLGYLLSIAKVTRSTHTILLVAFVAGLVSWLLDLALRRLLYRLTAWSETSEQAILGQ